MNIGNYEFEEPVFLVGCEMYLHDLPGVYVILDLWDNQYYVVDVGESSTVKSRIQSHDRESCWKLNSRGSLYVSVLYTPYMDDESRRSIERELRSMFSPACGHY